MVGRLTDVQMQWLPVVKYLENNFILLLVFIVNIEDVVEPDASIMSIIGGCLDTYSLVSVSPTEAMNVLRVQVI